MFEHGGLLRLLRAGNEHAQSREQRGWTIRFHHEIVRAQIERHDLVEFIGCRGEHDDGNFALRTNGATDRVPIGARKREVEYHAIEIARQRLLGRMREVFAAMHLVAIELEQVSQFVAQHSIIFNDEDRST